MRRTLIVCCWLKLQVNWSLGVAVHRWMSQVRLSLRRIGVRGRGIRNHMKLHWSEPGCAITVAIWVQVGQRKDAK